MSADTPTPRNCFVRASELYRVSDSTRIIHPAKEATDRQVRAAVEDAENTDALDLDRPTGANDRQVREAVENRESRAADQNR